MYDPNWAATSSHVGAGANANEAPERGTFGCALAANDASVGAVDGGATDGGGGTAKEGGGGACC